MCADARAAYNRETRANEPRCLWLTTRKISADVASERGEITFLPLHFKVNNLFLRKELQRLSSSSGEFGAATKKRRRREGTRHRAAQERKSRFLSLREGGARGDFGLHAPAPASRGKLRQQHTRRTRPHSRLTRLRLWLQLGPGRAQLCSV